MSDAGAPRLDDLVSVQEGNSDRPGRLMSDPDPQKADRVTKARLQMDKIEIDKLRQAYDGR